MTRERLEDVAGNDSYRINNYLDELYEPRPIDDILQHAESSVGMEFTYDVATSNCEHFVMLLRYGKPQSKQVQLFGMTSHTELYCTHKFLKITGLQTVLCQNVLN